MYCVVPFKNDVPSFFLLLSHSLQRYEESTLLDLHMRSLERDNGTNKKKLCANKMKAIKVCTHQKTTWIYQDEAVLASKN